MTGKFAPAPWAWETSGKPGGNGDFNAYVIDANSRKIAAVWGKRGEKEWTASLLSSAPDLFEIVEGLALQGHERSAALIAEFRRMATEEVAP